MALGTNVFLPIWLAVIAINWTSHASKVTVNSEGGYSGLVIAIGSNVPEDDDILINLKKLITDASKALHTATRGAMFFEEVTLSLPASWSQKPEYERTVKDNFRDADIRIDEASFSLLPETIQGGDCYEPGKYIQMSPQYIKDFRKRHVITAVGIPEKRFVREWAKLRYGVFEESVEVEEAGTKRYYVDKNGDTMPTVCSADIALKGYNTDTNGQPCSPDTTPGECLFVPDDNYVNVESSLMFSSSIPSVQTFCDNSPERRHNHIAPSKHNIKCKNKSTWEVITSHKDFTIRKVPAVNLDRDTTPTFRLVRTIGGAGRVVLVLDISGSMAGVPMELLTLTAKRHITDNAPEGSELGIVSFGTGANLLHPVTKINGTNRQEIADVVPSLANGGGTAIGRGLLAGMDALKSSGQLEGSVILLITDGEENEPPNIDQVLPSLVTEGVVVSVIAYGENASNKLEDMALKTGGTASIFRNIHNKEANTADLNKMIMEATTVQADVALESVQLIDRKVIMIGEELKDEIVLDAELGKNTVFTFSTAQPVAIVVELRDPSGKEYNWQSKEYGKDISEKVITFRYPEAENGTWSVKLTRPSDQNTDIDVTLSSEPKDARVQPVRVNSWIDSPEVKYPHFPKVVAMVTKSGKPVLNVNAEGFITGPRDFSSTIILQDNGAGPDVSKDDGLYSGFITPLNGEGRYSVRAKVTGAKNSGLKMPRRITTKKSLKKVHKRSAGSSGDEDEEYDEIVILEETFIPDPQLASLQRVQDAGVFRIVDWKEDLSDRIAPARVTDLEVFETFWDREGNISVTLSWTSSGDDLDSGNASLVELYFSSEYDLLLSNLDSQFKFNDSNLMPGLPQERVTINLPIFHEYLKQADNNKSVSEDRSTLYFVVRYVDESSNVADTSNVAFAVFQKETEPVIEPVTTFNPQLAEAKNETASAKSGGGKQSTSVIVISVILSILAAIAFLAVTLYYLKCKKKYSFVATDSF